VENHRESFWLGILLRTPESGQQLFAMYVAKKRRRRVSEAPMSLFPCGFRGSSLRHGAAPSDRYGKHTGNSPVPRATHAVWLLSSMPLLVDAGAPFVQRRRQVWPAASHPASFPSVVPLPPYSPQGFPPARGRGFVVFLQLSSLAVRGRQVRHVGIARPSLHVVRVPPSGVEPRGRRTLRLGRGERRRHGLERFFPDGSTT